MITKQLINSLQSEIIIATAAVQCSGTFKQYDNGYLCLEVVDNFYCESICCPRKGSWIAHFYTDQERTEKVEKNKTAHIAASLTGIGETIKHSIALCKPLYLQVPSSPSPVSVPSSSLGLHTRFHQPYCILAEGLGIS